MSISIPSVAFNDRTKRHGVVVRWMGTFGGGERVYEMCKKALKAGYRHFDTAEVGRAIRASGIPRNEIYITTKLPQIIGKSLRDLDCEYVDLYLMHWPQATKIGSNGETITLRPDEHPTIIDTWKDMEKLLATGKVKTIGVSNFSIKTLEQLLPQCTVIPATNQVECHPCLPQGDLKKYCDEKNIPLTAYSPLGQGPFLLNDTTIRAIAEELHVTAAQVLLSWAVQRGTVVIPKSENEERMTANIQLVELSDAQIDRINSIHLQPGMHKSLLGYHQPDGTVFGWSYEELGWNMVQGGVVPE
ncbi:Aldo/keto reductase [Guyanagaster necrorhizus]|uniref:Aldo/keto reductase n=1 Tax=Guyanagaster necrorhizus TaxID=856835 RepID=A0A9P7VZX2_9AGAR|nr:Aldo/keto reductase [Guyanagaster necrorhizus MCA 3950]KAG7449622.1 Aldo/keto reductase [Guyanagaster necrorhizus MCA 3950]